MWAEVGESLPEFPECESLFVKPVGATEAVAGCALAPTTGELLLTESVFARSREGLFVRGSDVDGSGMDNVAVALVPAVD